MFIIFLKYFINNITYNQRKYINYCITFFKKKYKKKIKNKYTYKNYIFHEKTIYYICN